MRVLTGISLAGVARAAARGCAVLAVSSQLLGTAAAAEIKGDGVDVKLLAQEGLAIALASTVLQTQLIVLINAYGPEKGCVDIGDGGGSYKVTNKTTTRPVEGPINLSFYFDRACKERFAEARMNARLDGDLKNGRYNFTGDVVYHDRKGVEVADLKIEETAVLANRKLTAVTGLGDLVPKGEGLPARLGLACALPKDLSRPFTCSGGVAQDFASLKKSIGSVSPIRLHLKDDGSVVFSGSDSELATAPSGKLKIERLGDTELALSDPRDDVGSTEAAGSAAAFNLFPPTPTSWTVTNSAKELTFSLKVLDDETRNSKAVVSDKTGRQLAVIRVDQSGTGTVKYLKGGTFPVVSWVLGG
jgi:hypothetical protein